jgi:hypothetical protein
MFRRGELFVHQFRFPQGEIRFEAMVMTTHAVLRLWDVDVAPEGHLRLNIGFRGVRTAIAELCALALEEGFSTVIVSGFRVSGAWPDRDVEWTLPCGAH